MTYYCLRKWNKYQGKLKEELCKAENPTYGLEYEDLLKLIVENILNQGLDEWDETWNSEKITVVDDGGYQGTKLFLIPKKTYQPSEYEYLITFVNYGSCSGCDTLQHILMNVDEEFNTETGMYEKGHRDENYEWVKGYDEKVISDLMKLCKDIVFNIKKPFNCGWRSEDEFDEVKYDK